METASTPFKRYTVLTRGILGGLFVGIATTVINLVFDFIYRKITTYQFSEFVNINSIIFFTIPTLVAAGIVFAILCHYLKKGKIFYVILSVVLTIVVAMIPLGPTMMPSGHAIPSAARYLTMGIEIITGIAGAFALPYFAEHPKIWSD